MDYTISQKHIEKRSENKPIHVLVTAPTHFLPDICEQLEASFRTTYYCGAEKKELEGLLEDVDALLVDPGARYRIDAELLLFAKRLKIVVTPSTGRDHIDMEYCHNRGIFVDSLFGKEGIIENIHASAEFSFALLLAMIRRLPPACEAAKKGCWREVEDQFRGIELHGKAVGLVGYGRIGKKMSRYLQAFGAKVLTYDPYVTINESTVFVANSLEELLSASQIVGLHVHLNDETKGMFGRKEFFCMPKGSYFLNTSRGELVDEDALLEALVSEHLAGAAVDVITGEQSADLSNHKLIVYARDHDNFIVTPHIAGLTVDSQHKATEFAVDSLKKFFQINP